MKGTVPLVLWAARKKTKYLSWALYSGGPRFIYSSGEWVTCLRSLTEFLDIIRVVNQAMTASFHILPSGSCWTTTKIVYQKSTTENWYASIE
jgi:hypothetical protein